MEEKFDAIIDNGTVIEMNNDTGWICPKCGTPVAPTAMFCPICGGKRTNENLAPGQSMICG